ncbi:MAG: class II glutamine amidotransferase [Elusimicrobia bacterium]|nr:class II glutamine amidotransferase [Elusimicrobiota bacterium]
MCRIFAQLSVKSSDPTPLLVQSSCSLFKQSNAQKTFLQRDGWGVASLKDRRFLITKSPKPVYNEKKLFAQAARTSRSRVVIAHLRAASNPLNLPMKKLIAPQHNQPFGHGRLAFAHNGTLNIAASARERLLGPYRKNLEGNNDSEIYFWILYKWYRRMGNIKNALRAAVRDIWNLWFSLPDKERRRWERPYTGLNAAISDGQELVILGHSLMPARSKSLCLGDQPYNQLAWRLEGNQQKLIAGSEKFDNQPTWHVLPQHRIMTVKILGGKIHYSIERFLWKRSA